jgi:hypothetical protein
VTGPTDPVETIHYGCPLGDWHYEEVVPRMTSATGNPLATLADRFELLIERAAPTEQALREHMDAHTVDEWVTALTHARSQTGALVSLVQKLAAELTAFASRVTPHLPWKFRHQFVHHVAKMAMAISEALMEIIA